MHWQKGFAISVIQIGFAVAMYKFGRTGVLVLPVKVMILHP